ncbi:MAG: hypothetical protein VB013_01120 [Anaerolineaceae bacterium]|nr:hypothetical protein [Anaerolineaceae bacterium]
MESFGVISYGVGVLGIFELDLTNGTVNTIVSPKVEEFGYLHSFSQNGKYLAVSKDGVSIFNLETGEKTNVPVSEPLVGNLMWSIESDKLVFGSCEPDFYYKDPFSSSISIYSLNSNTISKIIEKKGLFLSASNLDENGFEIFEGKLNTNSAQIGIYYWDKGLSLTATPVP